MSLENKNGFSPYGFFVRDDVSSFASSCGAGPEALNPDAVHKYASMRSAYLSRLSKENSLVSLFSCSSCSDNDGSGS